MVLMCCRKIIDRSLAFYTYQPECYKAEIARSTYVHGRLMHQLGKDIKSRTLLRKAYALRHEIVPDDSRPDTELQLRDFDLLVSVMHSGTRMLQNIEPTLLLRLIGPSP